MVWPVRRCRPLRLLLVLVHQIDHLLSHEWLRFRQRFWAKSLRGGLFSAAKSEVFYRNAFCGGGKLFPDDIFCFGSDGNYQTLCRLRTVAAQWVIPTRKPPHYQQHRAISCRRRAAAFHHAGRPVKHESKVSCFISFRGTRWMPDANKNRLSFKAHEVVLAVRPRLAPAVFEFHLFLHAV